ncbi:MAG: bifunctional precorrin-2 dehydrogenase/sirohydrochlorin ferrochelatase [Firmicutes bacterium]|nr:bifunctional precorrin-2 dehydrogenase/sirohydrochlorin ferrochelatase [Bacillota bacterium]
MSESNENRDRPWFPLYVDLSERDILFVGGGSIAARRIAVLQPFAEHITVVSPEAEESIRNLADAGSVVWIRRRFEEKDLEGRDIVFAATADKELNRQIADLCRKKQICVNASSDKELCDFYFPGIVRQGETVIGVNASGRDHRRAKAVRQRIQKVLTEEEV